MCPLFKLVVRGVQRCTPVNAQGVSGLLELLLAGFLFIPSITLIIANFLLSAPGRFSLVLKGLAWAICFTASGLPTSAILTFFLITLLIFSPLLLDELLNLMTLLEIMAFGAMDLAVLLVRASWLLSSHQGPAGDTLGNFLAGVICLGFLGGAGVFRSLDGKHGFTFALPVAAPTFLRRGGSILI